MGLLIMIGWPVGLIGYSGVELMPLWWVGVLVGLVLLIVGNRRSRIHRCSDCRSKLPAEDARLCAGCGARFVG
ncbi:MAG: hypothetical protein U0974_09360 [Gemmatimonadales bacterium]|nr:hypothetical protein [Gemmatimonadales bacterium]MDZ4389925.1 hypothetical protein [Gemmatimonadales bacterium]